MPPESDAQAAESKNFLPASLLVRSSALAIDLCVMVAACTAGFALLSLFMPADLPAAKVPIFLILLAACVYVGWGRNRFASLGRNLFGLELVRGNELGAPLARPLTVHKNTQALYGPRVAVITVVVVTLCMLIGAVSLTRVLATTTVFNTVSQHAQFKRPFEAKYGAAPSLSRLPSALLIGERHAYAQVNVTWGEQSGLLDYFLVRHEGRWKVKAVSESQDRALARYSLKAREEDVPRAPQ